MVELISPAEYARSRKARGLPGGTDVAVHRALKTGRIILIDGKIDPFVADIQWEKNTRKRADLHGDSAASRQVQQAAQSAPQMDGAPSWADNKARTEAAVAELKEIELAQKKGELIDRAGHERAAQQTARVLRDALVQTLPSKIALELAALTDPWAVECALRTHLRDELHATCGLLAELEAAHDGE